jgi:hypothetical protein
MVLVHVKRGVPPFQVGDFGPDVERSCKGAIYFRPGTTASMTESEYEHIKSKHPALLKRLSPPVAVHVRSKTRGPSAVAPKPRTTAPVPEPSPEPSPVSEDEETPDADAPVGDMSPSTEEDEEASSTGKRKRRRKKKT